MEGRVISRAVLLCNLYFCHLCNVMLILIRVSNASYKKCKNHFMPLVIGIKYKMCINLMFPVALSWKGRMSLAIIEGKESPRLAAVLASGSIKQGRKEEKVFNNNHRRGLDVSPVMGKRCNFIHKTSWGKCSFSSTFVTICFAPVLNDQNHDYFLINVNFKILKYQL